MNEIQRKRQYIRPYYWFLGGRDLHCFLGFHDDKVFDMMLAPLIRHKKQQPLIVYRCSHCYRRRYSDKLSKDDWMEWMNLQDRDFYKPLLVTPINSLFVEATFPSIALQPTDKIGPWEISIK